MNDRECIFQDSDGQGCPFCRCEIKGTEQVIVDPFNPHPQKRTQHMHVAHDEDDDIDVSFLAVEYKINIYL